MRIEQIGDCTLYQGDCLEVMPTLGQVDMVLADPPYGTTQNKWDSVIPLDEMWDAIPRNDNTPVVMTASQPFTSALVMSNPKEFKYQWVWKKTQAVGHLNAYRRPMSAHEDVCVFYKRQPTYEPQLEDKPAKDIRPETPRTKQTGCYGSHGLTSERKIPIDKKLPTSVICVANAQKTVHPTQKPVALMEYLIRTYTNPGDTVLDFTMGSGSTGVACVKTSRRFIGIEREAKYFDIACRRIEEAYQQPDMFVQQPCLDWI